MTIKFIAVLQMFKTSSKSFVNKDRSEASSLRFIQKNNCTVLFLSLRKRN